MRFAFGRNWKSFSDSALTPEAVASARSQFSSLLEGVDLDHKRFLDIGFGQGLALLLAQEKGAQALGIDIDPDNEAALRSTAKVMGATTIPPFRIASILDPALPGAYPDGFDVVHSWGVLHHTGDMRMALEAACSLVSERGVFVCAIYNRHWTSPAWTAIKWTYVKFPAWMRSLLVWGLYPVIYAAKWWKTRQNPRKMRRGMDFYHNVVDWVGGYPYEYASPEELCALVEPLGFACRRLVRSHVPIGCNEFLFERTGAAKA